MEYIIRTAGQLAIALRSRRRQRGFTQAEVGKAIGLLPKTVSGLETDPERALLRSFFQLLSALNLELVLRPKGESHSDSSLEW
ncbi:MAG: helix-turn-helix domain-containing protein [Bacteroidota bacterium]